MIKFLGSLISVDEAVSRASKYLREHLRLGLCEKTVWTALNHVLAEDVSASIDQPRYDRSAVDGYAVNSSDTTSASPLNPVLLRVKGYMSPSSLPSDYSIDHGEAVEVTTGAPLPIGADAVVMYEDTSRVDGYVEVYKPVPRGANVSRRGEDYRRGEVLVAAKTVLKPWHLAIIASSGYDKIPVYEKIRVGVIVTGTEVLEPGSETLPGKIYNSTGVLVRNYVDMLGFLESRYYGVASDDKEEIENKLAKAISENHVVITTGGTGVSGEDIVRDIIDGNGEWIFRGVAMRPGRPTSAAVVDGKVLFMLSGYPVAAWTGMEAVVKPAIYRALSIPEPPSNIVRGILLRRIPNTVGYRSYIRVKVFSHEGKGFLVEPYMLKGSGILSSLVKSNGYIVIPEDVEGYEEGELVEVVLYQ